MARWIVSISLAVLACGACNQAQTNKTAANETAPPIINERSSQAAPVENLGENVSLPDDRTPLQEPNGPIDPKSSEAAGQIVQQYGALIEQGRWTASWRLWSNADSAKAFDRNWNNASEVHLEIGKPGDSQGAAGSIYITEPVIFYGETKIGRSFRRAATVTLKRVNDVPGSTAAQRRWHIERIEMKG